MPDFFDKLREQIDAGLTKVTTKSRVTVETTRLRTQIRGIAKEKEEALARLGARVYQEMSQDGQLNQEGVQQDVKRIQEMDRSIEDLQKEIARLEALDAATPWSAAGGAEKPIATCTCGTPLTEGTKFCGNCGADAQEIIAKAKEEQRARVEAVKKAEGTSCPRCGAEISVTARFCRSCGAALAGGQEATVQPQSKPSCPHCGSEISSTARFCKSCGKPVAREVPPARTEDIKAVETDVPGEVEERPGEPLPGSPKREP
jgi:DNA-directed RNA polymerase subunit RPC12/RpoP